MRSFDPREHPVPAIHQLLLSGVAPRPIALVASLDAEGHRNLSPFSFFNAFSANPPVVVVSPAYRGTTGTPKHTFLNIIATREFTVSAVSYAMLHQVNLASAEYPAGVDEFVLSGLTPRLSSCVAPPGVDESPFILECRLRQHVDLGGAPGAGNLLIGEVVMIHVRESAWVDQRMHPDRLDLVARMGGNWYCRASGDALFQLPKPAQCGIGFPALPEHLRRSPVLVANDLARLAGAAELPDPAPIRARWSADLDRLPPDGTADMFDIEARVGNARGALLCTMHDLRGARDTSAAGRPPDLTAIAMRLHRCAVLFLDAGDPAMAWECALMSAPDELRVLLTARPGDGD